MTANSPTPTKPRRAAWPSGPDLRLLIVTGLCALLAGLMVAVLILVVSDPTEGPEEGEPIVLGLASSLEEQVETEGAIFFADPLGGSRSVWLAEEDGELVALSARVPGTADCYVDDTGTTGIFEDCEGNEVRTTQLDRYRLSVKEESPKQGALLIEFDRIIQAPANVER
jgi:hypothetical protein